MKRSAFFITSGFGDSILLIPLIKHLVADGGEVTLIFNSPFLDSNFFLHLDLGVKVIDFKRKNIIQFIVKYFLRYDVLYLDFTNASVFNIFISLFLGRRVIGMRKKAFHFGKLIIIAPRLYTHVSILNLMLLNHDISENDFVLERLIVQPNDLTFTLINDLNSKVGKGLESIPYIAVQVSAGNGTTPFKIWPIEYWFVLLDQLSSHYPEYSFLVLGDNNEVDLGSLLDEKNIPGVINLVGQTTLEQLTHVIQNAKCFIGMESGLTHLAVSLDTPSFTLFGASSYELYAYEKIAPQKHRSLQHPLPCQPCYSWLMPNTSRVDVPGKCPDFSCLTSLVPEFIFTEFVLFFNESIKEKLS